jgi:ATP-binding cassette subfamily B protein
MARHRLAPSDPDETPPPRLSLAALREARQLFGYLRPYRIRFAVAMLFLFSGSLLGLAFPAVAGRLIDLARPGGEVVLRSWLDDIDAVALLLLGVLVVQAACSFVQSYSFNSVGERSLSDLRRDAYGRLIRLPMSFHSRRRVGELASRLAADLSLITDTLIFALPHFLRQSTILIGGIILIGLTSFRLTLVMLLSFPTLIGIAVLFGRRIRRASKEAQDRLADSNVVVEETLQGVASVKAFANEAFEEGRYRRSLDRFLEAVLRGARARGAFHAFIVFGLFGALVFVLWYGAKLVQGGSLSIGALASFMLYTVYVGGAMGSFAELYGQLQRALGATHRVRELLGEPTEEGGLGSALRDGEQEAAPALVGAVTVEDVSFRYPSRKETEVLCGVTLRAEPGQRIALVGPSGAGKSTLVALLLRFYDPDAGHIRIDGRDLCEYPLAGLRRRLAVVPQDVFLFGDSIQENIAYGRPGATEAEVIEAAKAANAHDFIMAFPEGYKTRVGERGVQLSGGQRQRVAIARAVLRDPAVLILDEATSSLDSESEALVLQALDRLMEGRTSIVIAHRLSTVRRADRIFVLKEGRVVEEGTHAELTGRANGVYRTLTELQDVRLLETTSEKN